MPISSRTLSHATSTFTALALAACGAVTDTEGEIQLEESALVRNVHAYEVPGEARERLELETDRGVYTFDRLTDRTAFELRLDAALVYKLDVDTSGEPIRYRFETPGQIESGVISDDSSLATPFSRVLEHQRFVDLAQRARLEQPSEAPFAVQHQEVAGDCGRGIARSLCQLHCLSCAAHPFRDDPWCLGHFLWCLNPLNSVLLN